MKVEVTGTAREGFVVEFHENYTILRKHESSQPELPWGIIKHSIIGDLYLDGTIVGYGPNKVRRADWVLVTDQLKKYLDETNAPHPLLTNKLISELQEQLQKLPDSWELDYMAPLISQVLDLESYGYPGDPERIVKVKFAKRDGKYHAIVNWTSTEVQVSGWFKYSSRPERRKLYMWWEKRFVEIIEREFVCRSR